MVADIKNGVCGTIAIILAMSSLVRKLISTPYAILILPCPFSNLLITLIKEDLPQPLGPAIPINSPLLISKSKLFICIYQNFYI